MEGRHFDRWTRALAGASRRDTLKLLAAGSLLVNRSRGALAQVQPLRCGREGDRCDEREGNRDCCSGFKCKNDRCREKDGNDNDRGCGRDGDNCRTRDCCKGYRCKNDRCRKKKDGGGGGGCGKEGDNCRNKDCCKGFRCKNDRCRRK